MNLGARYWRFSRKLATIAEAFQHACSQPVDPHCLATHELARENATIQLQDQWSAFCRDLILGSWRGGAVTLGGARIPRRPGGASDAAALHALRATYTGSAKRSRQWEPKWFDPIQAIDAAKRLSIPNLVNVSLGLGLTPSPLDQLRAVRNYFAHRGQESSTRLALHLTSHPTNAGAHLFVSQLTLGGVPAFVRWTAEIETMAWAAAQ